MMTTPAMKMPIVMTPAIVSEIARIGELRKPNEACGVLLPVPMRGRVVWEIPNRAEDGREAFVMHSDDVVIMLQDWVDQNVEHAVWENVVLWHTHPSGSVGPSRADLDNRIEKCGNLVVALTPDGPVATWF